MAEIETNHRWSLIIEVQGAMNYQSEKITKLLLSLTKRNANIISKSDWFILWYSKTVSVLQTDLSSQKTLIRFHKSPWRDCKFLFNGDFYLNNFLTCKRNRSWKVGSFTIITVHRVLPPFFKFWKLTCSFKVRVLSKILLYIRHNLERVFGEGSMRHFWYMWKRFKCPCIWLF